MPISRETDGLLIFLAHFFLTPTVWENGKKCHATGTFQEILCQFSLRRTTLLIKEVLRIEGEIDDFGKQANKTYKVLAAYFQKHWTNRLLKENVVDFQCIITSVALGGAALLRARLNCLEDFQPKQVRFINKSAGRRPCLRYESSIGEISADQTKEELLISSFIS